jgi:flagellin FlaB
LGGEGEIASLKKRLVVNNSLAAIGIGSLIIFIAMILVAGIAAQVLIQTMDSLQEQALKTGEETLRDISGGLEVTHASGYYNGSTITQLAIFSGPTGASEDIDLTYGYISISDSSTKVILNYTATCFASSPTGGLFGTLDSSKLSASTYGILVIRDIDGSCTSDNPVINERDLVVLMVNTTQCFSGIGTRTDVFGYVHPEYGVSGVIAFTTPSVYVDTIIDLQP